MSELEFKEYWRKTEVIREYRRMLYTFGDMRLPYVFTAEHRLRDRTVVMRGIVLAEKPHIILPGYYSGPEFLEGFKHKIPFSAAHLLRNMGLPYSHVSNRIVAKEEIEYGKLQRVLDKFNRDMEKREDEETGLIKGLIDGADVSLIRYFVGLTIKSAPENFREFFEHMKRQKGEPIGLDERITDEDIRRLFE